MVYPATYTSVCGQRVRGCCGRIDSGTCKADIAGDFGQLCARRRRSQYLDTTSSRRLVPHLLHTSFHGPQKCGVMAFTRWLLPARFDVFARDPGKLTMPCFIVTKYHALR